MHAININMTKIKIHRHCMDIYLLNTTKTIHFNRTGMIKEKECNQVKNINNRQNFLLKISLKSLKLKS